MSKITAGKMDAKLVIEGTEEPPSGTDWQHIYHIHMTSIAPLGMPDDEELIAAYVPWDIKYHILDDGRLWVEVVIRTRKKRDTHEQTDRQSSSP
jgi:hypothetical protein